MLIKHLSVSGLLSFGPSGIDLPMKPLNVLIGPNGSGKSNLIDVLSLLHAAPRNLSEGVNQTGGIREWLWKGQSSGCEATIDAVVSNPDGKMDLRHVLSIREHGSRFEVSDERIENGSPHPDTTDADFYYRFQQGNPQLLDFQNNERGLRREQVRPEESILSQVKDPERYPALTRLQTTYEAIRLYRNWSFGPNAALRREQSAQGRSDFLVEGGDNLALVLSKMCSGGRSMLLESLQKLYEGVVDINLQIDGGNVLLFLEEQGGREIPATRLSDGTLRYLCLLAILLHPNPPELIAIEEPELGLHPDMIMCLAPLLQQASQRMQLVVTTHSRILVDALTDDPSSIVVCEKKNGETHLERLEGQTLVEWLERYSLGELWSMGEIGGNRW